MTEQFLKLVFLMIGVFGIWMIFGKSISEVFNMMRRSRRFKVRKESKRNYYDHKWISKARTIVSTAHKNKISFGTYNFIILSLFMFSIILLIIANNISITNILFSLMFASTPIIFTLYRFYFIRIESSHEGERLISEFMNQYSANDGNILETINDTAKYLKEEYHSKTYLSKLYFELNNARNEDEVATALANFNFSIDTQWANMLSHSIYSAYTLGADISASLSDILKEIKNIRSSIEDSKRKNNEGFNITLILAPLVYIIITYYGLKVTETTFVNYLVNQFTSPIGYKLFVLIVVVFLLSIMLQRFLRKPKFD